MTVNEVAYIHGARTIRPSDGATITDIVRQIYDSDSEIYFHVLRELNHIVDWFSLSSSEPIKYIDKSLIKYVDAAIS